MVKKMFRLKKYIKTQQYNFQQSGFSGYQSSDTQDPYVLCRIKGICGLKNNS